MIKPIIRYLLFCSVFLLCFIGFKNAHAQSVDADTTVIAKTHSPKTATLWSLIPGAGQIYNRKYWKLPIVYAGFGATTYFAITNGQEYTKYSDAYICSVNAEEPDVCDNELAQKYTSDELKNIRDYYRRNMELSYILMGVWYIIQILDAAVDAHLYYWEVDEDITVKWEPVIQLPQQTQFMPNQQASYSGLSIKVNF